VSAAAGIAQNCGQTVATSAQACVALAWMASVDQPAVSVVHYMGALLDLLACRPKTQKMFIARFLMDLNLLACMKHSYKQSGRASQSTSSSRSGKQFQLIISASRKAAPQ